MTKQQKSGMWTNPQPGFLLKILSDRPGAALRAEFCARDQSRATLGAELFLLYFDPCSVQ
jgi:hypothetical protein